MHLYVQFLSGKRQEIGCGKQTTVEALIQVLILKDKLLKEKQFSLLIEKEKRIITKDEYTKTLNELGIVKEDYLTIVLSEVILFQNLKFNQQSIPNQPQQQQQQQQQQQIPFSQELTGQHNNHQTQKSTDQNILTPSLQYQLNQQKPLENIIIQENIDTMNKQLKQTEYEEQIDNQLNLQLKELRAFQYELQAKINLLIGELEQVNHKIQYLEDSSSLLQVINLNKQNLLIQEQFLMSNILNKQYLPLDITTQIQQDLDKMKKITLQMNSYQQLLIRNPNQDQIEQIQTNQGLENDSNQVLFHTLSSQLKNQFKTDSFQQQNNESEFTNHKISVQQTIQDSRDKDFHNISQEVQYLKEKLQQQCEYIEELKRQILKQQQTIHAQKLLIISQFND